MFPVLGTPTALRVFDRRKVQSILGFPGYRSSELGYQRGRHLNSRLSPAPYHYCSVQGHIDGYQRGVRRWTVIPWAEKDASRLLGALDEHRSNFHLIESAALNSLACAVGKLLQTTMSTQDVHKSIRRPSEQKNFRIWKTSRSGFGNSDGDFLAGRNSPEK